MAASVGGFRFWINNQLLLDKWHDSNREPVTAEVYLPGGILNFMVHYYENPGGAMVGLSMTKVADSGGSGSGFGGGSDEGTLPPASTYGTVNATALNMRSGPGSEHESVRTLHQGDVVQMTGLYDGYWVHVQTLDNFAGWVFAPYLDHNLPVGETLPAANNWA